MPWRFGVFCIFLFPIVLLADEPKLASARQRWLRGNAAEARALYEQLLRDPQQAAAATVGLSRIEADAGDYDAAEKRIEAALKDSPNDVALLARAAELAYFLGRFDVALQRADQAIQLKADQFLARWIRACIYRDTGDLAKSDTEFRWFVKTYTARDNANNPIKEPDELLLVGLAGSENARWHSLSDQFRFILNEVYGDAIKAEADFWPAEYQAGMLLLEKYNRSEANQAFDKALTINPRAAAALVGKGEAALQALELKDAEKLAQRALAINPKLPSALRLMADMHWQSGELAECLKRLEEARAVNARDEATLGRLAACLLQMRRKTEFDTLCAATEKANPKAGRFYYELAEALEGRRLYLDAAGYYKKAIELWPQVPGAASSLGLLDLRLGREETARPVLAKAFEKDPFNVRVSNSIKVLRHLEKYETITTPHFLIRFDPQNDKLLARYLADYFEAEFQKLAKQFDFQPPEPILVELFNRHEMFSGRMIAMPDLHTIGASSGRMIAMASPKAQGVRKPYNWARVVRHELVHVFNLEATGFQCPHWLTEGLAVRNESLPRPPAWNQLLAERFARDELFHLGTINLGFMRPRTPDDWTLAYAQASIYVQYAAEKYGAKAIPALLAGTKESLDTPELIRRACGVDLATFEAGYKAYLKEQIAGSLGKPPEKPLTLAQLEAEHERKPEDSSVAVRLAEQYLNRKRSREARDLADHVLKKNPGNGLALFIKAKLQLAAGEDEQALAILEKAAAIDPPEPKALKALGKMYYDAADYPKAIEAYSKGRKSEPMEVSWLEDLAKVFQQSGDKAARAAILAEIAPTDADNFAIRKTLAELYSSLKQWPDAERWAREALEIDVTDAKAQELFLRALSESGKNPEAERLKKLFN